MPEILNIYSSVQLNFSISFVDSDSELAAVGLGLGLGVAMWSDLLFLIYVCVSCLRATLKTMTYTKWQSKRLEISYQKISVSLKISNTHSLGAVENWAHSLYYEQLRNTAGQESRNDGALHGAETLNFSRITEAEKQLCIMHSLRTVRLNTLTQATELLFAL